MEKKSKKGIIIGIAGLLLVTLTLLGLTYAYYRTRIIGNQNDTSVSVTSDKLEVKYQNESAVIENVVLEPGGEALTKTFEVANTGNGAATYSVWLEDMTNTFERNQDLQYTLTKEGTTDAVASGNIAAGDHQILIPRVSIDANNTDSYTLTINYVNVEDVDQTEDMGSTLQFKINIREEAVTLDNATEGTLLYAIKDDRDTAFMGSAEDDYGTSYYYTGSANNYVTFSGKCWRIVRVQGDGTIKLTLIDANNTCADYQNTMLDDEDVVKEHKGALYTDNYSYGNDILYQNSDIRTTLNNWLNSANLDTSKMVETSFCNDTSVIASEIYGIDENYELNDVESAVNGTVQLYTYGALERIENKQPSLKCNFKGIDNTTATRVKTNIATFTADEVYLAGIGEDDYLTLDGTGLFWTMTPYNTTSAASDPQVYIYGLFPGRSYFAAYVVYDYVGGFSPIIVLSSDVTIEADANGAYTADGTQTNAYIIS